jgi:cell division protein FtsB
MPPSTDRAAAQRQALADLLGRFTADRDTLLATLQAYQEQLAALTARVTALEAALAKPRK